MGLLVFLFAPLPLIITIVIITVAKIIIITAYVINNKFLKPGLLDNAVLELRYWLRSNPVSG